MKNVSTVVVAVDFGGRGLDGARWVAKHFAPDSIVLVHALHLPSPPSFLKGIWGDEEQIFVSARSGATERLEESGKQLERETKIHVESRVRMGEPADQIALVADAVDADLVVIGPHSGRKAFLGHLGSTAERVIHETKLPTLLATGELRDPHQLLAAIDDSAVSDGLFEWIKALEEQTGARAAAINVIDNTLETNYRAILAPRSRSRDVELEREASAWLTRRLSEADMGEVEGHVALGEPALEILAMAERVGADLLLMGTRGAGAAGRFLMGGVARLVTRGARCPVLLLPAPK